MKRYPKQVAVFWQNEGEEDEFLEVWKDIDDLAVVGESRKVALYELKEVVTVTAEVKVSK